MHLNQVVVNKLRREYGRQPLFSDRNEVIFSEAPNHSYFHPDFVLKAEINASTQLSKRYGFSEMETINPVMVHKGMYHFEGGWPKDVNFLDEEQSLRHRKRAERDDNYGPQLTTGCNYVMASVLQNNAVNIYQDYFVEFPPLRTRYYFDAINTNIYHDLITPSRPISTVTWGPGGTSKFLSVHTVFDNFPSLTIPSDFYTWEVDNPLKPIATFQSNVLTSVARYCPKDENLIAGGLISGKAAIWDARIAGFPVNVTPIEEAHKDVVAGFCWVHSKTNTEFYTGSPDGSVCFWDGRNLRRPFQLVYLDTVRTNDQSPERSHGCNVLEFEYTIPVRFMAGSNLGSVFLGNRKGLNIAEIAAGNFRATNGPILGIERNPQFVKNFLVIGGWSAKLWTEDSREYPLTRFPRQKSQLTCAIWSPTRSSLFMTGNKAGELDFWDLILDHKKPVFKLKQFNSPISALSIKEDGKHLLVATESGDIFLLELEDILTLSSTRDKALVASMMERELQRCKLQEARTREIRLIAQINEVNLSLDEQLRPYPIDEDDSIYDYEDGAFLSEDEEDLKPIQTMEEGEEENLGLDEEEGLMEEEQDIELKDLRVRFFGIVDEERAKYLEKEIPIEKCPFDAGYIPEPDEASPNEPINVKAVKGLKK